MPERTVTAQSLIATGTYSSSAGTVTGQIVTWPVTPRMASFEVRVAVAPTTSGSGTAALDVYLQHSPDYLLAGAASSNFAATWDDFVHFPQIVGGSSSRSQFGAWVGTIAPSSSLAFHTPTTAALAANTVIHGPTGASWRAQAVISGTSPAVASSSAWNFQVISQTWQ